MKNVARCLLFPDAQGLATAYSCRATELEIRNCWQWCCALETVPVLLAMALKRGFHYQEWFPALCSLSLPLGWTVTGNCFVQARKRHLELSEQQEHEEAAIPPSPSCDGTRHSGDFFKVPFWRHLLFLTEFLVRCNFLLISVVCACV